MNRSEIEVVTVAAARIRKAERKIEGREHRTPNDAEIPFDWIPQKLTGRSGMVDFMMLQTAKCPNCKQTLTEKTLIEPK